MDVASALALPSPQVGGHKRGRPEQEQGVAVLPAQSEDPNQREWDWHMEQGGAEQQSEDDEEDMGGLMSDGSHRTETASGRAPDGAGGSAAGVVVETC